MARYGRSYIRSHRWSARRLVGLISQAIGRATEADSAQTISWAPKHRLVNRAVEIDSALPIAPEKSIVVAQAVESDSALVITPEKMGLLGQAIEIDSGQAIEATKTVSVGQATEADSASAITAIKTVAIGQALESDIAQAITALSCASAISTVTVDAWETDLGAATLHLAIDEVIPDDTDFIRGPTRMIVAIDTCEVEVGNLTNPGVDTGHTVSYRYSKSAAGGQILDLNVRLMQGATTIATWTHINIGDAWTTVVQTLTAGEAGAIINYQDLRLQFEQISTIMLVDLRRAQVSWTRVCIPAPTGAGQTITIGQASEVDSAQPINAVHLVAIGQPAEIDLAQAIIASKTAAIGQATETDSAQALQVVKQKVLGQATENDEALALVVPSLEFSVAFCNLNYSMDCLDGLWKLKHEHDRWELECLSK